MKIINVNPLYLVTYTFRSSASSVWLQDYTSWLMYAYPFIATMYYIIKNDFLISCAVTEDYFQV